MIYIVLDRARAVLDIGNAIYALQRGQTVIPFPYAERPSRTSLHPHRLTPAMCYPSSRGVEQVEGAPGHSSQPGSFERP